MEAITAWGNDLYARYAQFFEDDTVKNLIAEAQKSAASWANGHRHREHAHKPHHAAEENDGSDDRPQIEKADARLQLPCRQGAIGTDSVSKAAGAVDTVTSAPIDLVNSLTGKLRNRFKPRYASDESVRLRGSTRPTAGLASSAMALAFSIRGVTCSVIRAFTLPTSGVTSAVIFSTFLSVGVRTRPASPAVPVQLTQCQLPRR